MDARRSSSKKVGYRALQNELLRTFWKQFFEASANVALSGYEEPVNTISEREEEAQQHAFPPSSTPPPQPSSSSVMQQDHNEFSASLLPSSSAHLQEEESVGDSSVLATKFHQSTPKELPSDDICMQATSLTPIPARCLTPTAKRTLPTQEGTIGRSALLHRVLDTNWRVQATPLQRNQTTQAAMNIDSSPMFSPSPTSARQDGNFSAKPQEYSAQQTQPSVLTLFDDLVSDDEDGMLPPGMSPPKTIQFTPVNSNKYQTHTEKDMLKEIESNSFENVSLSEFGASKNDPLKEESWEL
ncbi:DASH complex subunit Ask1 [Schizosaccharomyces japonicus yFS275]|uniref:DASH complex subunit ASK1 n=1 Tax=Schizosaccharomyces japonicus (strain yFS275 / FY16936) TaxID=402676 RepID=B6JWZ3_SCHJY|nr:DASH complex subunit Ask1 [Schizosaccharomyces japonicus yFS275]EEB05894.1 DASH complex subunit Ask1 [Schizosaccharomyces japonicus yFS275]